MKTKIILTALLLTAITSSVHAQLAGRKFISGSASLNFSNANSKEPSSNKVNSYGYGFDLSLAKFTTENRVSGWSFGSQLSGGRRQYVTLENNDVKIRDIDGINGFTVGIGHFWNFYKHFNEKIGIYGGPGISLSYNNERTHSVSSDSQFLFEQLSNNVSFSLGVNAGIYYKLSDKWWVDASLAFANPVSVSYGSSSSKNVTDDITYKSKQLNYSLSPVFNFPSVGIGVRYFYGR